MIVTAALIWWNERPEDLARCVRGMATIADRLVAVDGAYARYPGATVRSPKRQEQAIQSAAFDVGIDATVVIPDRLWAGQVEKRAYALGHAALDSDWVAVFDADWVADGDRRRARKELAAFGDDIDVVSVPFYTPPGEGEVASGWHTAVSDTRTDMPHLFRALPEMTVEKYHWHFGARKGKQLVWLWGPPNDGRPVLRPHPLQAAYRLEHLTLHRTPEQVLASRAFINDRITVVSLTGQEDDMDDLPRPVFDYDTIPLVNLREERWARKSARQAYLRRKRGQF